MVDFGNLFQNKLFLQYLSGAGEALSTGQSVAPVLNQITQQNIAAQSKLALQEKYRNQMLREALEGGGSLALTKDGYTLKGIKGAKASGSPDIMSSILGGDDEDFDYEGMRGRLGEMSERLKSPGDQNKDILNPFPSSSLDVTSADLAGLTPQDITQALSGAIGAESLRQKSINDVYSMILKSQPKPEEPLDREFPVPIYGHGAEKLKVSHRQWNSFDKELKSYSAYRHMSELKGEKDVMTQEEWRNEVDPNTKIEFLEMLSEDPKLLKLHKEILRDASPTVNIGLGAEQRKRGTQRGELFAPDIHTTTLAKLKKNERSFNRRVSATAEKLVINRGYDMDKAKKLAEMELVLEDLDRQIRNEFSREGHVEYRGKDGWYLNGKFLIRNPYAKQ